MLRYAAWSKSRSRVSSHPSIAYLKKGLQVAAALFAAPFRTPQKGTHIPYPLTFLHHGQQLLAVKSLVISIHLASSGMLIHLCFHLHVNKTCPDPAQANSCMPTCSPAAPQQTAPPGRCG